jgi:hypothetical protein
MIREVRGVRGELRPETKKALDGVCIISPLATASDATLLYEPSPPSGASDVPQRSPNESVEDLLEKSCGGLQFWRTIATDDVVLCDLIEELERRQCSLVSRVVIE